MKIKSIAALTILLCSAFFATGAMAIGSNIDALKEFSNSFSSAVISPTRYLNYDRELSISKTSSELREVWEMELPENNNPDAVFFALASQEESNTYASISFSFAAAGKKSVSLPAQYKKIEIQDPSGKKITINIPFANIPTAVGKSRLTVKMTMAVTDALMTENNQQMTMPKSAPVERAQLIVRSEGRKAAANIESHGFYASAPKVEKNSVAYRFAMKEPWSACRPNRNCAPPGAAISFGAWPEIANEEGGYYSNALGKPFTPTLQSLGIALADADEDPKTRARRNAFSIYKWIGGNFSYSSTPINFDLSSKFMPKSPEKMLVDRNGDCKDFAVSYIKLLSLAGIYAEPVEVSNDLAIGPIPLPSALPFRGLFNHVIVYVPEIDEYIDPTGSDPKTYSSGNFAIDSAKFSNTYGLKLFSRKFLAINPGKISREVQIDTVIQKQGADWIATTRWFGANTGYQALALMLDRRDKWIKEGRGFDAVFKNNGLTQLPDSWRIDKDELHGRMQVSFSYKLNRSPVDGDGRLLYLPKNIMTGAFLKYASPSENRDFSQNTCFASEVSGESIKVIGSKEATLPENARKAKIFGVNSSYTQNIETSEDSLTLKRSFSIHENRPLCSDEEMSMQKAFYEQIDKINGSSEVLVGGR